MGFAMVNHFAGPNWRQKAGELQGYNFVPPTGPDGTWNVTSRSLSGEEVVKAKTLPAAYIAALKHQAQKQQAAKTANDQQIATYKTRLAEAQELIKVDIAAIQKRIVALNEEILRQNADNKNLADQILGKTAEAQELNEQIALRREETERMRSQLEELRAQNSLMNEKKRRLNDLLTRSKGQLERARRRYELLKADASGS